MQHYTSIWCSWIHAVKKKKTLESNKHQLRIAVTCGKGEEGFWGQGRGQTGISLLPSQFIRTLDDVYIDIHYIIFYTFSDLSEKRVYNSLSKTLEVKYISKFRLVI